MNTAFMTACFFAAVTATDVKFGGMFDKVKRIYNDYKDNQMLEEDPKPFPEINVVLDGLILNLHVASPDWFSGVQDG